MEDDVTETASVPLLAIAQWGGNIAESWVLGMGVGRMGVRRATWRLEEAAAQAVAIRAERRAAAFAAMSPLRRWLHTLRMGLRP